MQAEVKYLKQTSLSLNKNNKRCLCLIDLLKLHLRVYNYLKYNFLYISYIITNYIIPTL